MMQIMLLSFDFFERFVCFFKKKNYLCISKFAMK